MRTSLTRTTRRPRRRLGSRRATVLAASVPLLLTGCGASGSDDTSTDAAASTVQNCGIDVTVDGPPKRVYAAYQPGLEIMHALGLSDRVIGAGFLDAQVLPEHADAQAAIETTAQLPSRDSLLAKNPDFVISGYNNVFTAEGDGSSFGSRASLSKLGIQSWILSPLCPSADGLSDEGIDPATVTVETVYSDIRDLGTLFGVEERAEKVISGQQTRIAAVADEVEDADKPTVAILLLDEDGGLRVASGIDFGTRIIEAAGGENIFADQTAKRHVDIDIEELIRRDPDIILTDTCCRGDMTRKDGAAGVATIVDNPALAGLKAVRNDEVHAFLFSDRAAGVRAAHAIELLASILHPDLVSD